MVAVGSTENWDGVYLFNGLIKVSLENTSYVNNDIEFYWLGGSPPYSATFYNGYLFISTYSLSVEVVNLNEANATENYQSYIIPNYGVGSIAFHRENMFLRCGSYGIGVVKLEQIMPITDFVALPLVPVLGLTTLFWFLVQIDKAIKRKHNKNK